MFEKGAHVSTLSISFQPGSSYVIPLQHFESPFTKKEVKWIMLYLSREVWENTKIVKIGWNLKFEHKWLKLYGCELRGRCFDGMIAKYYLDENTRMGLKENVAMLLPEFEGYEEEQEIAVKKYGGWTKVPLKIMAPYNALDSDLTLRLMLYYHERLIENGFYLLFRNLRMMATIGLAECEFHGMRVNTKYLQVQTDKYKKLIEDKWGELMSHEKIKVFIKRRKRALKLQYVKDVRKEMEELLKAGKTPTDRVIINRQNKILAYNSNKGWTGKQLKQMEFNFGSPDQVRELFFYAPYGFNFKPTKFTDSGKASTAEDVLLDLQKKDKTGFIQQLLDLRGLEKINSTYIEGMWKNLDDNGYVHSSYKAAHTVTHRLSSEGPNQQNVPRILTNPDVKPMFEPPLGFLHWSGDYGQAELRIAAELSEDKNMIEIFQKGYNIHTATAVKVVTGSLDRYDEVKKILKDESHPENEFWERQKKKGKTINFGILYGQGDNKLAEGMGVPLEEAKEFKREWFSTYPQLVKWIQKQIKFARKNGYVYSIWGYKRRLPDIWSVEKYRKAEAERQSVNAPIQGAASDFTLFSSIIHRQMRLRGELPAYLVMRVIVHDDLGYYMKPEDVHATTEKLLKVMIKPPTLKYFGFELKHVLMKASPEIGGNWGHKHDLTPELDLVTMSLNKFKK